MRLDKLIEHEIGYRHYSNKTFPYTLKTILARAREQGVLPEICSKLGFSLRSAQRWIPTARLRRTIKVSSIKIKVKSRKRGSIPRIEEYKPFFPEMLPPEYEFIKRKNKKKKSLNISKGIRFLLWHVLVCGAPIPDKEPTDREIMRILVKFKKSVGTWKKVSEELDVKEMVLYRIRKTGKMKKWQRILFYILLQEQKP